MSVDGVAVALFGVADAPRYGARAAVERLHQLGLRTLLVTGDILAEARPEDKLAIIERLRAQGLRVGMIGDGVNDAPALAAAGVVIAMGLSTLYQGVSYFSVMLKLGNWRDPSTGRAGEPPMTSGVPTMRRDDQPPCPTPRSQADIPRRGAGSLVDIKAQRTLVKAGALAALGVLEWTGMQRPRRRYMSLHAWTGIALIGLTLWHWSLHFPRQAKPAGVPRPGPRSNARPVPSGHAAEG